MVESAQNWHRQRAPDSLNGPRDRRVLAQLDAYEPRCNIFGKN